MNGVNRLVVNKMDVLRKVGAWGTTEGSFYGEHHFRLNLVEEFGPTRGSRQDLLLRQPSINQ